MIRAQHTIVMIKTHEQLPMLAGTVRRLLCNGLTVIQVMVDILGIKTYDKIIAERYCDKILREILQPQ